ncbi:hypothetical protein MTR67_035102 [Solanum verrucosum]|uniref:Uncharacterized protein n=1 Tax=Solanum verrucosum TaxID=315347 RepID=A0AAF0ZJX1_SOLVR|nr:hypothetical protein MTR67_035102 [Solanum verrucosum]
MEEEGGARKSPKRSPRILSNVGTSNQKVYRRSRMRGQVSSPTDEVNDCPNFSLGISQVSGSSHGLDMLTNEVIELRKELVKVNENNKALEEKIDLGFNQIKEFVVNSNKQLLEDISLLFAKNGGSSSVIREVREPSKKQAGENLNWRRPFINFISDFNFTC